MKWNKEEDYVFGVEKRQIKLEKLKSSFKSLFIIMVELYINRKGTKGFFNPKDVYTLTYRLDGTGSGYGASTELTGTLIELLESLSSENKHQEPINVQFSGKIPDHHDRWIRIIMDWYSKAQGVTVNYKY